MNITRTYNKDEYDFKYREFDCFARNYKDEHENIGVIYYALLYDFHDDDNPKSLYICRAGKIHTYDVSVFNEYVHSSAQALMLTIDRFYEANGDFIV